MTTFKHSGDLGDIIYALPTIRALGGGTLLLSLSHAEDLAELQARGFPPDRYPTGVSKYDGSPAGLTPAGAQSLLPLLERQSYLREVKIWEGEKVDVDLNEWRAQKIDFLSTNLADSYAIRFSLPRVITQSAWLETNRRRPNGVVFARSLRYRNERFPWAWLRDRHGARARFVGLPEEWEDFRERFGDIEYAPTANIDELAEMIAGSELFVGNQSLPYALAEALKVRTFQETAPWVPNCLFPRENAFYFIENRWTRRPLARAQAMLLKHRARRVATRARAIAFRATGLAYSRSNERKLRRLAEENEFPFTACAFHAQGIRSGRYYHPFNYQLWQKLNALFFATRPEPRDADLTILTCTNLRDRGSLERSLEHVGWRNFAMLGGSVRDWSNIKKLALIDAYLPKVDTPYVMFADSHDVIVTDPAAAVARFAAMDCDMLCNAEKRVCYPKNYGRRFERGVATTSSPYVYLNSGVWIARTEFAREFFADCVRQGPIEICPTDDQVVFKHLYPKYFPRLRIDQEREILQTLQFAKFDELRR